MARLKTTKSIDDKILECEEKHGKLAFSVKNMKNSQYMKRKQLIFIVVLCIMLSIVGCAGGSSRD